MNPALEGYAAAELEVLTPESLAQVAADLEAVDRSMVTNVALRSALTDAAVSARARRAVMNDLLEGRVRPEARRLAAFAAASVPAPEVPAAISWVAHRARQAVAREAPEFELLGRSDARKRVGGYAVAVFEGLSNRQLEEVEDELFRFTRIVDATPRLRAALTDRDLPASVRQAVTDQLLEGKADPATVRLVRFVLVGGRARDVVATLDWLVDEAARARGWRVARVRTAAPLADDQRDQLARAIEALTGAPVDVVVTVERELIGGAVVEVGDLLVDASARGRLERLREQLVGGRDQQGWLGRTGPRIEREEPSR